MKKAIKFFIGVIFLNLFICNFASADVVFVPSPADVIMPILQIVGLLSASFFIEAIVFYFLGSRRIRNFFWLLLANFISYPTAVFLTIVFEDKLSSWDLFSGSEIVIMSVIWLLVEIMVFFIEYGIMYLGLRKHYPKKQIALFVFIANLITALIGLIFSFYLL